MSRRLIRSLVALSVVSIVGILTVQAVWLRKAYALHDRQFRQSAFIALQDVADRVARLNRIRQTKYAVTQLAADYFVVNTDAPIDPITLEHLIQTALRQHDLITDFEYGIYDCATDQMVYGNYVATTGAASEPNCLLPKFPGFTYYFGIRFPNQSGYVAGDLTGWLWSTGAVLLVVLVFGYTLIVVLRQRRLTEVQRDFINNITHELQTPVSTLRIAADVLQQPAIANQPERLRQYARIIDDESRRLQKQIQNVLQLARATHGRATRGGTASAGFKHNRTETDLHTVLNTLADAYGPVVSLDLQAERPMLYADPHHLDNLLHNLIDNAIKYSPPDPRITLSTRTEGNRLIWSVSDNGMGIAPEHQRAVFRQFYRVPGAGHRHDAGGFGLGLYYVRQVARAHGWRLTLTSRMGQGSTFTLDTKQPKTTESLKPVTSGHEPLPPPTIHRVGPSPGE